MTEKLLLDKLCHHKQLFNWKKCNKQLFSNIRQQTASTVIPDRSKTNNARPTIPCFRLEVLSELGCREGNSKALWSHWTEIRLWGSSSKWNLRELHRKKTIGVHWRLQLHSKLHVRTVSCHKINQRTATKALTRLKDVWIPTIWMKKLLNAQDIRQRFQESHVLGVELI